MSEPDSLPYRALSVVRRRAAQPACEAAWAAFGVGPHVLGAAAYALSVVATLAFDVAFVTGLRLPHFASATRAFVECSALLVDAGMAALTGGLVVEALRFARRAERDPFLGPDPTYRAAPKGDLMACLVVLAWADQVGVAWLAQALSGPPSWVMTVAFVTSRVALTFGAAACACDRPRRSHRQRTRARRTSVAGRRTA